MAKIKKSHSSGFKFKVALAAVIGEYTLGDLAQKYNCKKLVYYEQYAGMIDAIEREKQIKAGSRAKKIILIESMNPNWDDLYNSII